MTLNLKTANQSSCMILWPMMMHYHTKYGSKRFSNSENIINDILKFCCDLDLEQLMLYYQTKFACKWTSTLKDRVEIVLFWLRKPSMWPWNWRQWPNFSALHSGSWCCITIPSLVRKCSVVQKISSGQTFTGILNLCCDLHFECSNPIFPQNAPVYDAVLPNQVWFQTDQHFWWYRRNSPILNI